LCPDSKGDTCRLLIVCFLSVDVAPRARVSPCKCSVNPSSTILVTRFKVLLVQLILFAMLYPKPMTTTALAKFRRWTLDTLGRCFRDPMEAQARKADGRNMSSALQRRRDERSEGRLDRKFTPFAPPPTRRSNSLCPAGHLSTPYLLD
jgi:hypothetical protein